jgi:predicted nucleotidyltransferase
MPPSAQPTDFAAVLATLADGGVPFIVVGGLAARAHGAPRLTQDVDVVYRRRPQDLDALAGALAPHRPYLRGAPPGLPFVLDAATLAHGLNFTLVTALGDVDLLGEIAGGGNYEALIGESVKVDLFGHSVQILGLPALIRTKRAAGRPKDIEAIAELELLLALRNG